MAYSTIPKVRRDGTIILNDGTGSPITLTVAYEEGNFSFDVPVEDQTVIRDRSVIAAVRKGDEQPITGSFSFFFRAFTDAAVGGVRDFITKTGAYSGNTSTGATGTPYVEHYCVDIKFQVEGTDLGDSADHSATLSRCVCSLSFAEGDPDTYSLSFTCYGGVVYTGQT